MELVVVLFVLVALAGIVVPLLPNMVTKTQSATMATNISELNRAIQMYEANTGYFPDQWDALSDGTTVIDYMANGEASGGSAATQVGGQITQGNLTDAEVSALSKVGIQNLNLMPATIAAGQALTTGTNTWDPNFNPYLTPLPTSGAFGTPITTSTAVARITGQVAQLYGASPTGGYVVFGIGQRCTMVTQTITEAPTVFTQSKQNAPNLNYARYVAIFKVSESNQPSPMTRAILLGVFEPGRDQLNNIANQTQDYFNSQTSSQ